MQSGQALALRLRAHLVDGHAAPYPRHRPPQGVAAGPGFAHREGIVPQLRQQPRHDRLAHLQVRPYLLGRGALHARQKSSQRRQLGGYIQPLCHGFKNELQNR